MARPSMLRFAVLLGILAMLLPVAALADSCTDCLGADSVDCCPPSCCPCCLQLSPAPAAVLGAAPAHAEADLAERAPERHASPDPRDVLHVPKTSRA
ncbi:MAG TPA: hypothetical protein VF789_31175 [Thermoanaerobaculia bacterium]